MNATEARLTLAPGMAIYVGGGITAGMHRHHAVQLVFSSGPGFELQLGEGSVLRAKAAIVAANVDHALASSAGTTVLVLVEPSGQRGRALDALAHARSGQDLSDGDEMLPDPPADPDAALAWCDARLASLGCSVPSTGTVSPTVERALAYLDRAVGAGVPQLRDAARVAGISMSRLTHLFTAEVGIPFRRYVLWLRIKTAIDRVRHGASLTDAAVDAGFSDSAHLSRTFRDMFGLAPSSALGNVQFAGCFCR